MTNVTSNYLGTPGGTSDTFPSSHLNLFHEKTNPLNIWDNFPRVREGSSHLDVWRMLYNLLVLLQDLLELSVLLHYSLVLEANSMLLVLLPVCGCSLQLL